MPEDQIEVTVIATGFNGAPIRDRGERAERAGTRAEPPRGRSGYKVYASARGEQQPPEEDDEPPATPPPSAEATLYAAMGMTPDEPTSLPSLRESEDVFELKDPILEPVETKPQIPVSYRPEEKRAGRNGQVDSDLDIPTFIRRRTTRLAED